MRRILACMTLFAVVAAVAGCMPLGQQASPADKPVDPNPPEKSMTLVLHFPDRTGRWLEMEPRAVKGNQAQEAVALAEWVSGPKSPSLGQFLPQGTSAELVEVRDGTAFVSLSQHIRNVDSKRIALVLQALVNTMTEVEGISRVQILVDRKKEEGLAKGIFAGEPVKKDMNLVARQGYRPIVDCDFDAGELNVTGVVSAVNSEESALSLKYVRIHPEAYFGSGRQSGLRTEAGSSGTGAVAEDDPVPPKMPYILKSSLPTVQLLGDIKTNPGPSSVIVKMPLRVAADAVVHREDESLVQSEITLADVKVGDIVRVILTRENVVRAILVCYQEA